MTFDNGMTFVSHGCFQDNETRPSFDLSHGAIKDGGPIECATAAALANHLYFALEFGGYCYSTASLQKATSLGPSSHCTTQKKSIDTGGDWAYNLYEMDEGTQQKLKAAAVVAAAVPTSSPPPPPPTPPLSSAVSAQAMIPQVATSTTDEQGRTAWVL